MEEIRFDDIAFLEQRVSADFGPWGPTVEVTQAMIDAFADVTGDHQWIHVDPERAASESPFGTTVAHGFLTLALLPRLSLDRMGGFRVVGHGNVTNLGADALRFLGPVRSGSQVRARRRLKAVAAGRSGTRLTWLAAIHVVGSARPALTVESIVLYQPARSS